MGMKKAKKVRSVFWYIGAIFISLITVYPFLWMIATSFKPEMEIYSKSLALFSENFSLQNYKKAFDVIPFGQIFPELLLSGRNGSADQCISGSAGWLFLRKIKIQRQKSHLQPASVLHDDSRSDHDDSAVPGSEKLPAGRRKQYLRTGRSGTDQPLCGYYSAGCSRSLCSLLYETVF